MSLAKHGPVTTVEMDTFIQWRDEVGFDTSNPDWINCRNASNFTPLQQVIVSLGENKVWAPMILQTLLDLGADPTIHPPYNEGTPEEEQNTGNAIAFASSRGVIQACYIMYQHNPAIVHAPTGPKGLLDAFTAAAFQLDNELPEDESARSFEIGRKEACEALIRLFVVQMKYDVNTPLSDGETALGCLVLNNRPIAAKMLMELGGNIGAGELDILQLAACAGANKVLPVIKEHCAGLFNIEHGINAQPLILAMSNSKDQADTMRYKETIKFIANQKYVDGRGIIKILSIAVQQKMLLSLDAFVEIWATQFDSSVNKTPLMWAMENNGNSMCQRIIKHISTLSPEILDQMPEFGKGFRALDDDHINMHYPQFVLDADTPHGIRRCAEFVPNVAERESSGDPTGVLAVHNHPQFGPGHVVHANSDAFNYACTIKDIEWTQTLSANPKLGKFNNNCRQDHIHFAVRFANKETVDNIARKESDTLDNVDCFMRSSLDYAAKRWVDATYESQALEAKYIMSALCHYGANPAKVCAGITNQEFLDIFVHSEEIYAEWHPDAEGAGVLAAGLAAVSLDAPA